MKNFATTRATATLSENSVLQTKTESIHTSPWKQLITSNVQIKTARHFGSRIAFDNNDHLFISMGDRDNRQDLSSLADIILRLNLNGSIPPNNPSKIYKTPDLASIVMSIETHKVLLSTVILSNLLLANMAHAVAMKLISFKLSVITAGQLCRMVKSIGAISRWQSTKLT